MDVLQGSFFILGHGGVAENTLQKVVEIVRNTAGQGADRLKFLSFEPLFLEKMLFRDVIDRLDH